ncbi:MAG: elongation factor T [Parcubacteria group bacterium LiPW_30]|nr:MAG: elongation factor T [Parcubacteria group bacterium LiPW_30]
MDQVKELRDMTGVSVMQCKKALEEAQGDKDKAIEILKRKSKDIAGKKGDRTLGSGTIQSYIHLGGAVGSMVLLSSETDFVSKNEEFKKLAYDIAMHIAAANPEFVSRDEVSEETVNDLKKVFEEEAEASGKTDPAIKEKVVLGKLNTYFAERALLEQPFVKNGDVTVGALVDEAIQKFGERIEISRFARFSSDR